MLLSIYQYKLEEEICVFSCLECCSVFINISLKKRFVYSPSLEFYSVFINISLKKRFMYSLSLECCSVFINISLKKRFVYSLIWSVARYGSESWTLKKDDDISI